MTNRLKKDEDPFIGFLFSTLNPCNSWSLVFFQTLISMLLMPLGTIGESRKSEWLICDIQGAFFEKG